MATEVTNGVDHNGAENKTVTFTAVKPQLFVEASKANDAVSFYKSAFGAEEVNRVTCSKRKADQEVPLLLSAEIKLGDTSIIVSDVSDDSNASVKTVSSGLVFCLETDDVEAAVEKAVKAGAVADGEISEGEGTCCGGRVGKVTDPYGVVWAICTPTAKKCANVEA
ncbi:putative glyoxalase/Bleomycin resistance protein/Dihydroxybiphenyl dioxygenase [Helianthus anomalus]